MKRLVLVVLLVVGRAFTQDAMVTPLMAKDLEDIPGKEATMITVEVAPGAKDTIHRHNAHVFVYVLEGSLLMQVRGGKEVKLGPGGTFYEGPDDVHTVGRSASSTQSAKFLVFFVKDKGAPLVVPAKGGESNECLCGRSEWSNRAATHC